MHPHVVSPENPHLVGESVPQTTPTTTTSTAEAPKPAVTYVLNEFQDGDWKGFKFVAPEYNSLDQAITDYGVDKILSLLNTQIDSRIRTKVKNSLKPYSTLKGSELVAKQGELASKNGGILFTEDNAKEWRPEVRELSPNQLFRQAKELSLSMQKETDPTKKMAMLQQVQELMIKAAKMMAE